VRAKLDSSIGDIVALLHAGGIVALKGLGAIISSATLAMSAPSRSCVVASGATPAFAVMAANIASAQRIGAFGADERALLQSMARPIVVVDKRGISRRRSRPGLSRIGVVLPYAPVHHLMFTRGGKPQNRAWRDAPQDLALVATSANPTGEPLISDDDEAREKLKGSPISSSAMIADPRRADDS